MKYKLEVPRRDRQAPRAGSPQFVCIINGGQNLIAPNAQQAEQNIQDGTPEK